MKTQAPQHNSYDIVIIGGAVMGASAAWFLASDPAFEGRILVVDRDLSFAQTSTMHTTSCMRQQFSGALNVRISQFAAEFVKNMRHYLGDDPSLPDLTINSFGYMYLADTPAFAQTLRDNQKVQQAEGAETQLLSPEQIKVAYPFYNVDDILLGSINLRDEGYWDAMAMFDGLRRAGKGRGVETIQNEVVAITKNADGSAVQSVTLKSGDVVHCGLVLNASGPRADRTARMAGIELPVEPRKRYSWVFSAEKPLDRPLPLTIDPSGVHVRENGGGTYQCGGHGADDPAVDYNDFAMDHSLWLDHIWPVLATRIPQFEAIKVTAEWAGHYAFNTFDHNAILGPHSEVANFYFLNGFSGHGLQQAPAMGRGTAELILHGGYQTLDLSPFHFGRLLGNQSAVESAVI